MSTHVHRIYIIDQPCFVLTSIYIYIIDDECV